MNIEFLDNTATMNMLWQHSLPMCNSVHKDSCSWYITRTKYIFDTDIVLGTVMFNAGNEEYEIRLFFKDINIEYFLSLSGCPYISTCTNELSTFTGISDDPYDPF
jgi:hypothetical protein